VNMRKVYLAPDFKMHVFAVQCVPVEALSKLLFQSCSETDYPFTLTYLKDIFMTSPGYTCGITVPPSREQ
jgi:hypothetical protein